MSPKRFGITGTDASGKSTVLAALKRIKPQAWALLEYPHFYIDETLPYRDIGAILTRISNLGDEHQRVDWKALGLFLSMQLYGLLEKYVCEQRRPEVLITERQAIIDSLVYGSIYKQELANMRDSNRQQATTEDSLHRHLSTEDMHKLEQWIDQIFAPFGWTAKAGLDAFFSYMLQLFSSSLPELLQKLCQIYQTTPCDHLVLITVGKDELARRLEQRKKDQTLNEMHENLATLCQLQNSYRKIVKDLQTAGILPASTTYASEEQTPDQLAQCIVNLINIGSPDKDSGAKAFHLQELAQAGFRVPAGFVIKDRTAIATIKENSIQALGGFPVAVRSSALDEDGREQSFAGQFESYLNIHDLPALRQAIEKCFESYHSQRAASYRQHQKLGTGGMRVLVQKMVAAECAGVAFSLHPTTGDENTFLIEAVPGLGDVLVGGEVNPSRYQVPVFNPRTYTAEKGDSEFMLSAEQVQELAQAIAKIQAFYGLPQDIEWAFDHSRSLFILQSRPITHIPRKKLQDTFSNADFRDGGVSARPCTPLMASLYKKVFHETLPEYLHSIGLLKKSKRFADQWISEHYGRLYWNASAVKRCLERIPGFDEREFDQNLGIACDYGPRGPQKTPVTLSGLIFAIPVLIKLYRGFAKITSCLKNWRRGFRDGEQALLHLLDADFSNGEKGFLEKSLRDVFAFHDQTESRYFTIIYNNSNLQSELDSALNKLNQKHGSQVPKHYLLQGLDGVAHLEVQRDVFSLCKHAARHGIRSEDYESAVKVFLNRHYHCGDAELDLLQPRWRENPKLLQDKIDAMLRSPDQIRDPDAMVASQGEEFQNILKTYPFLQKRSFVKRLKQAREFLRIREEFRVYSSKAYAILRSVVFKLGETLVRKFELDEAHDIFFLSAEELLRLDMAKPLSVEVRSKIKARKNQYLGYRNFSPTNELGGQLMDVVPEAADSMSLKGLACSQGRVTGIARVIYDPNQMDRLGKGEILVTKFTDPGWTPMLGAAAAVVTEVGGLLSHAAVISREFGIPAVLNVNQATSRIHDGQQITVDGATGYVQLS